MVFLRGILLYLTGIMKRSHLIQLALIIVAMICGYKFLETLIAAIISMMFQTGYGDYSDRVIITYFVVLVLYAISLVLLVRFNREISNYIDRQGNAAREEEKLSLRIEHTNLLFIAIVVLSLITLIDVIPRIIFAIYNTFKNSAGRLGTRDDLNFKTDAIQLVFALIILLTAKPISLWLGRQFSNEKPLIETTSESQPNV